MLATTQGFVFRTTPYSETSVIAKIFTLHYGIMSFMIKGVRSSKGRNKQNLLQPLSYIDISFYYNHKAEIQYIKELKPAKQWNTIPFDCSKTTIIFFMTELLYKTIREEEANLPLFKHIATSLNTLDNQTEALGNFPITFMISTAKLLGIEPRNNYDNLHTLFNLNEGCFVTPPSIFENANNILDNNTSLALYQYLSYPANNICMPYIQRNAVLKSLLQYYKIHFENLSDFQSHIILHEVLQYKL